MHGVPEVSLRNITERSLMRRNRQPCLMHEHVERLCNGFGLIGLGHRPIEASAMLHRVQKISGFRMFVNGTDLGRLPDS